MDYTSKVQSASGRYNSSFLFSKYVVYLTFYNLYKNVCFNLNLALHLDLYSHIFHFWFKKRSKSLLATKVQENQLY